MTFILVRLVAYLMTGCDFILVRLVAYLMTGCDFYSCETRSLSYDRV